MANLYNSNNPRKKQCVMLYCLLLPVIMYVFISLSALSQIELSADNLIDKIKFYLFHFLSPDKINDKTVAFIFIGLIVWAVAFLTAYTKASMNLMHGEEHGTASWGNIKQFNKKYAAQSETENKILSENIRMTYDKSTLRNNNMFVVGGSGAGKTAFLVSPNLLNCHGSNIYTDPKGGLLADYGEYLKKQPNTRVYAINLCEMNKSMHFNPFEFIREDIDVAKLINNIIKNTTPEGASSSDPFWEQAETMYLQSVFYYIWKECPLEESNDNGENYILEKNFSSVLKLLDEAKVNPKTKKTLYEMRLEKLRQKDAKHPACVTYDRMKVAAKAEETIASILLCANSRFNKFDNPSILNILSDNDIPLDEIGTGINHDGKTKSFFFLIIPDDDDTYNFIPGMIYTLLFQELYYQARFYPSERLPLDVGFWFDEFANIKMPGNFEKILATCRSRGIYCVPILQSLAQIKKLYKDGAWEGVVGNCDTFIYLGGNEQSSHKYISELLGKWTIDKQTTGESKGQSGSSSKNLDVLARDLIDSSEMRLLPNEKEIIFIKGEKPLIDRKWHPWEHDIYDIAKSYGTYELTKYDKSSNYLSIVNEEQIAYYERKSKADTSVKVNEIDLISFLSLDVDSINEDELQKSDFEALFSKITDDDIEKIEEEEKNSFSQLQREEIMAIYDDLSLIEIFESPICESTRRDYINELRRLGIEEQVIKKKVSFDIPLNKVKEFVEIARDYATMGG